MIIGKNILKNMFDLSKLAKGGSEQKVAKELFLELIDKQLTFQQSMSVCNMLRDTLASWGAQWLDSKYLGHIKNDLEGQGKKL